ncbi:MAG: hypothetical protein ABIP28_14900 [Mucilaginibacter sp.]
MTAKEFKRSIAERERFDTYFNYGFFVLIIMSSLFLFYKKATDADYNVLPLAVPFFLLVFGVYGIWRKYKDRDVAVIPSDTPVDEKKKTVVNYLKKLNVRKGSVEGNFYQVKYFTRYWTMVCLYIYVNNDSYYINVKGAKKFLARDKEDESLVRRATLRIENYIKGR